MARAIEGRWSPRQRAALRVGLMSLGAAALYGSWAVAVNWSHGFDAVVHAGSTQVAYSITTTAVLSSLMEALFRGLRPGRARVWLAATISTVLSLSVLVCVHVLAGTLSW